MANRMTNQFRGTFQKSVVDVQCRVTFGSSGAPTLVSGQSAGIVSVTRNSTGKYTFVFGTDSQRLDLYNKFLGLTVTWDESANSGTAPLAALYYIFANSITTSGTASMVVQLTNSTGTATDPASTEAALFDFCFRNSNAPA